MLRVLFFDNEQLFEFWTIECFKRAAFSSCSRWRAQIVCVPETFFNRKSFCTFEKSICIDSAPSPRRPAKGRHRSVGVRADNLVLPLPRFNKGGYEIVPRTRRAICRGANSVFRSYEASEHWRRNGKTPLNQGARRRDSALGGR